MNRILILLPYFERPNLVKNGLNSILKANKYYTNWTLAFIDDGSKFPARKIVEDVLKDHLKQIKYFNTKSSVEKKMQEGCIVGGYMNLAMKTIPSDICVILNDDDELVPDYLYNLNLYFSGNLTVMSCWSKLHLYNPYIETSDKVNNVVGSYNQWKGQIEPFNKVEGCQVAWRTQCFTEYQVRFESPCTGNYDAYFLQQLYEKTGPTFESGIVGQYKSLHSNQLSRRAFDPAAKWCLNGQKAWSTATESTDLEVEQNFFIQSVILHAGELQKQNDFTGAIKRLRQALKCLPNNSNLHFTLGMVLTNIDLAEAITQIEEALTLASQENIEYCKTVLSYLRELDSQGVTRITRPLKLLNMVMERH